MAQSQNPPDLSVVIINWRLSRDLAGVLPSIERQARAKGVEVIVVNKASGDGTEELLPKFPFARLVEHPVFGIAEMRNRGIRESRGRYCLMLDSDTEVLPGCFDALVEFMDARPELGACGGHTTRPDGELEYNVKRFYDLATIAVRRSPVARFWPDNPWNRNHLMTEMDHGQPFEGDWIAGACFCMRRDAIAKVGLFDDRYYFGYEDVDWCWRAKRLGWKIGFCPDGRIIHKVQRKSAKGINRLTVEHVKSGLRFWWKKRRMGFGLADDSPRLEPTGNTA